MILRIWIIFRNIELLTFPFQHYYKMVAKNYPLTCSDGLNIESIYRIGINSSHTLIWLIIFVSFSCQDNVKIEKRVENVSWSNAVGKIITIMFIGKLGLLWLKVLIKNYKKNNKVLYSQEKFKPQKQLWFTATSKTTYWLTARKITRKGLQNFIEWWATTISNRTTGPCFAWSLRRWNCAFVACFYTAHFYSVRGLTLLVHEKKKWPWNLKFFQFFFW